MRISTSSTMSPWYRAMRYGAILASPSRRTRPPLRSRAPPFPRSSRTSSACAAARHRTTSSTSPRATEAGSDPCQFRLEAQIHADGYGVFRHELHAVHILIDRQLHETVDL